MLYGFQQDRMAKSRGSLPLVYLLMLIPSRIMHDIVLPIWKSNASISLMIDKKAKRYVGDVSVHKPDLIMRAAR
jgi:hypothetical protein